jgi:hypothetical protein
MNEWKWPIDGPFAGSIQARTLPNIGSFTNYSPIQTRNSSKIEITKPNPMISTPSVPKSLWTIPVPNSGDFFLICYFINPIIAKLFNF